MEQFDFPRIQGGIEMIDLSKHIQEGARLELEALEQSMDEGSFLSAQNSAQAMRIDELQAEIGRMRLDALTWYKRCHDLEEELAAANAWKEAVIDELVVDHIFTKEHETNPRKALQDAITWNCQVALDPAVSEDARKLIAAANARVDALSDALDYLKGLTPQQYADLRKDAERLAWIEALANTWRDEKCYEYCFRTPRLSLRESIDAAIAAKEKP